MAEILIVDDQACIQEFLSDELIAEGYAVEMAVDVESLRGCLRFSPPDLILLDLLLDDGDGFEILHEIKDRCPGLPVIIFTAYDSYREDPRMAEADGYVIKSLFLGELKEKIGYHLESHRRPNAMAMAQAQVSVPSVVGGRGF